MTNHTDTSRSGELLKELRIAADRNPGSWVPDMCGEAADRIEALEAENERLRGALKRIQHFSPAHMWRAPAIKEIASGALEPKP